MPPPFITYMLRCADTSYFVGHTDDLELALAQHGEGSRDEYTAKRLPVELAWSSPFADRDSAFAAERRLKGWSRAKREGLIAGDVGLAQQLARLAPVSRVTWTPHATRTKPRPQMGSTIEASRCATLATQTITMSTATIAAATTRAVIPSLTIPPAG